MKIEMELPDFRERGKTLIVQQLLFGDTLTACRDEDGASRDMRNDAHDCPLPADWIIFRCKDEEGKDDRRDAAATVCDDHLSDALWNAGQRTPAGLLPRTSRWEDARDRREAYVSDVYGAAPGAYLPPSRSPILGRP